MLVTFIGSPISGKTTTAAQVFAELKKSGMPAEFICEIARQEIATRRVERLDTPLVNGDQLDFMFKQYQTELTMTSATPESVVISDSSALNSLFYMTPDFREAVMASQLCKDAIALYSKQTTLVFFSQPIHIINPLDPNRVHTTAESLKIHEAMLSALSRGGFLFSQFQENDLMSKVLLLNGPADMRANDVLRRIYSTYTRVQNAPTE
jgi:predicted ATPase